MNTHQETDRNQDSYRRMKHTIDKTHPRGWFVAIANDQVVAAAADFHVLEGMLHAQRQDPRNVLVAQAGVDYPEHVTIVLSYEQEAVGIE